MFRTGPYRKKVTIQKTVRDFSPGEDGLCSSELHTIVWEWRLNKNCLFQQGDYANKGYKSKKYDLVSSPGKIAEFRDNFAYDIQR